MRTAAVLVAVVATVVVSVPPAGAQPRTLFRITDDRITEASGLAVGLRSPGVLYVQNDSGDSSRFFALDASTGRTAATVHVGHARNDDWEDLAVADDAAGTPSVWLGDLGDNDGDRDEVVVYRVDEPRIAASDRDRRIDTADADVWRLRYPDGSRPDAESLAVTPQGVAYVVTKSLLGGSVVYRLPASPDPDHVRDLTRVGAITFSLTGTPGGPSPVGELTATGASFSHDGTVFAVRTYTDAYVWRVAGGDLAAALGRAPVRVALPRQPQGEGIAVDGDRLLVDSEGVGEPVYAVPLPTLPGAATAPPTNGARNGAATAPTTAPSVTIVPRTTPPATATRGTDRTTAFVLGGLGGAVLLLLATGAVVVLRRRARPL